MAFRFHFCRYISACRYGGETTWKAVLEKKWEKIGGGTAMCSRCGGRRAVSLQAAAPQETWRIGLQNFDKCASAWKNWYNLLYYRFSLTFRNPGRDAMSDEFYLQDKRTRKSSCLSFGGVTKDRLSSKISGRRSGLSYKVDSQPRKST